MKKYMDFDSGEIYTEDEIRKEFEAFKFEFPYTYGTFEKYMEEMLCYGRQRTGGYIEIEEGE